MKLNLAVVIPVLNNFTGAVRALQSLKTSHHWTPLIADQWVKNNSLAKVWNAKCSEAFQIGYDYCLVINDDILFYPQTVDNLVNHAFETDVLLVSGVNANKDADKHIAAPMGKLGLHFSCFLLHPAVFDRLGYFDENFFPAYFEDNDFCYRAGLAKEERYGFSQAPFYHAGSTTIKKMPGTQAARLQRYFQRNRVYYHKKWGGPPGEEVFTSPYNNLNLTWKDWIV